MLERLFRLEERGTTVSRELRAGVATFLTMAYILLVNPSILADAGMPAGDVAAATAIASAIACFTMAWLTNYPFALAPGMGLNAYFAYTVVGAMGVSWQVALAAVFVEGLLFLALSLAGARRALLESIPSSLKTSVAVGIGLFLAMIGLQSGGLVVTDAATLVGLGDLGAPSAALTVLGVVLIGALVAMKVPGAIVIGIGALSALAWSVGLADAPRRLLATPSLPTETFLALDLTAFATLTIVPVVLAFLLVDLLDTAGTLIGVGQLAGFTDDQGNLPRASQAFAADAVGTSVGALLGTSTVTTYVESAAGVEEGGRTGLVAVIVGLLFLLALVFTPLFVSIPPAATAPALVIVGAMMMRGAARVPWDEPLEAIPAFLTVTLMPFTFSIANGLSAGVVSWVLLRLLSGRWRQVSWPMIVLTLLIVVYQLWVR